jgi:hypothetical protein
MPWLCEAFGAGIGTAPAGRAVRAASAPLKTQLCHRPLKVRVLGRDGPSSHSGGRRMGLSAPWTWAMASRWGRPGYLRMPFTPGAAGVTPGGRLRGVRAASPPTVPRTPGWLRRWTFGRSPLKRRGGRRSKNFASAPGVPVRPSRDEGRLRSGDLPQEEERGCAGGFKIQARLPLPGRVQSRCRVGDRLFGGGLRPGSTRAG